jgi:HDOD domain
MAHSFAVPTYQSNKRSTPASDGTSTPDARGTALEFLRMLALEVSRGSVDLPCFPDVVVRIRNALAHPGTTLEQTVTIVGAEPRLAAQLIQTAASAAFNPGGRPLTDLRTAITRLGHRHCRRSRPGCRDWKESLTVPPVRAGSHCTPVWTLRRISARSSNGCAAT